MLESLGTKWSSTTAVEESVSGGEGGEKAASM